MDNGMAIRAHGTEIVLRVNNVSPSYLRKGPKVMDMNKAFGNQAIYLTETNAADGAAIAMHC
jgi:hypothetical protein